MIQEEIIEGNRLIAEYMGYQKEGEFLYTLYSKDKPNPSSIQMDIRNNSKYHSSWNWLMPVWMKIIQMEEKDFNLDEGTIGKKTTFLRCCIYTDKGWNEKTCYHDCIDYKNGEEIESKDIQECLYKTVVDFIKWYNITKTK